MPLVERDVKPAATEEPGSFFYQEPNSGLARDESRNIFEDGVYTLNEYALSATNLALYRWPSPDGIAIQPFDTPCANAWNTSNAKLGKPSTMVESASLWWLLPAVLVGRRGSEERLLNCAMILIFIARRRSSSYSPNGKNIMPWNVLSLTICRSAFGPRASCAMGINHMMMNKEQLPPTKSVASFFYDWCFASDPKQLSADSSVDDLVKDNLGLLRKLRGEDGHFYYRDLLKPLFFKVSLFGTACMPSYW
jgi:hypothetical protein